MPVASCFKNGMLPIAVTKEGAKHDHCGHLKLLVLVLLVLVITIISTN